MYDYAQARWAPWSQADIKTLEQVQQRFTRQLSEMGIFSYEERLKKLELTKLLSRRRRGDMIDTYKKLTVKVDAEASTWFNLLPNRNKVQRWPS